MATRRSSIIIIIAGHSKAQSPTNESLAALREKITNHQYINKEETPIEVSTIAKETQGDTEEQTQKPHYPRTRRITRESSSGKSPRKKKTIKKKNRRIERKTPKRAHRRGS